MVGAILEVFIFTRSKFPGSCTAVLVLMTVVSAPTYSLAGGLCIGTEVALDKGEAVVTCPLPVNVKDTRHSVLIKHCDSFSDPEADKDTVLECHWPTEEADEPICKSNFNFSRVGQLTDQFLAKLPVSMLMVEGAYKAQLSPRDPKQPFTSCRLHRYSGTDEVALSAVTRTPAALLSRTESHDVDTQEPQKKETPHCEGQGRGEERLCVAILFLQSFIIIFLAVHICLRCRNKERRKEEQDGLWKFWRQLSCAEKRKFVPTTENPPGNGLENGIRT